MKLKYRFIVRQVDDAAVAIAVGADAAKFNGMIRLNQSGELIFKMLFEETDEQEVVRRLAEYYALPLPQATEEVRMYLQSLRDSGLLDE